MMLLAPMALWFLVIGGAVVALYLLKIKRRAATVPVLEFWLALAGKTRVHSLFDRLKRLLSMLLWLIIVICLVLAIGNPILSLGRIKPRAIAVIIDNSASMQAIEPASEGRTRFELARQALREISGSRPVTDEWMLIEAGREPRVLQPWTFDTAAIRRAGDAAEPFSGAARLHDAIELASQLIAGKQDPCIVIISDGAAGELVPLTAADERLIHWPIGTTRDNAGIGQLAVRAHRQNGNYHALISVVNASDEPLDTQVTLEIDGRTDSVELVSAEAGGTWEKSIVIDAPTGGVLRASLDRADALAIDNEAFAILEPIRPAVVWLVTPTDTAFFFEQALASMDPLVWTEESLTLTPEQYPAASAAAAAPDASLRRPDLTIFNGWAPEALPAAGRFMVVNACPAELGSPAGEALAAPQIHLAPRAHPLMQHVSLQGSRLAKANRITLRQPGRVLAHSAEGDPLIALIERPERQTLLLTFDVLDSDLPFRNAFPLLLRNTVSFMHEEAPSWLRPAYRLGETIRPSRALPAGTSEAKLTLLRGGTTQESSVPVVNGSFSLMQTNQAGAVRLEIGDDAAFAAMNIGEAAESRIAPVSATEDHAAKLGLSRRLLGGMPWLMLAMFASLAVVLEWLTYHFRWTE